MQSNPERTVTLIIHPRPLYAAIPSVKFDSQTIKKFAITATATEATVPICDILSFYVYKTKQLNSDDANLLFHPDIINHLRFQPHNGAIQRTPPDKLLTLSLVEPVYIGVYTSYNSPLICIKLSSGGGNFPYTFVCYAETTVGDALQFIYQEYLNSYNLYRCCTFKKRGY